MNKQQIERNRKLRREYEAGATLESLSSKYSGSKSAIRRAVINAGGTMRPQGSRYHQARRGGILDWLDN